MIKIKDYIFNENEIHDISQIDYDGKRVVVNFINTDRFISIEKATFEDIEWNYGTPQETQRKMQKELCKSCYYRDTISNKLKDLEEENKRLELENEKHKSWVNSLNKDNHKFRDRINKAIEYIEDIEEDKDIDGLFVKKKEKSFLSFLKIKKDLLKIFKGGENE